MSAIQAQPLLVLLVIASTLLAVAYTVCEFRLAKRRPTQPLRPLFQNLGVFVLVGTGHGLMGGFQPPFLMLIGAFFLLGGIAGELGAVRGRAELQRPTEAPLPE